jgi:Leucine-rich repeat (LRR) protein
MNGIFRYFRVCFIFVIITLGTAVADDFATVQTILDKCGLSATSIQEITATEDGRIVSLDLKNRDLSKDGISVLPAEIGQLSALKVLICSGNIIDSIPAEIGSCTSLQKLDMSSNRIVAIPPAIGQCVNLTSIDLRHNRIAQIPPEIGNCKKLVILQLWGNKLTSLEEAVVTLPALDELYLKDNRLTTLPASIVKRKFGYIDVIGNKLCDLDSKLDAWMKKVDKRYRETQKCW